MKEKGILIAGLQQQKTFHNEHILHLKERKILVVLVTKESYASQCFGLTSKSASENSENPVTTARWKDSPNFPLQTNPVKIIEEISCQEY